MLVKLVIYETYMKMHGPKNIKSLHALHITRNSRFLNNHIFGWQTAVF
jgi:hypothetical protein